MFHIQLKTSKNLFGLPLNNSKREFEVNTLLLYGQLRANVASILQTNFFKPSWSLKIGTILPYEIFMAWTISWNFTLRSANTISWIFSKFFECTELNWPSGEFSVIYTCAPATKFCKPHFCSSLHSINKGFLSMVRLTVNFSHKIMFNEHLKFNEICLYFLFSFTKWALPLLSLITSIVGLTYLKSIFPLKT